MKKLRAIGISFVVTVGPALVLFGSVMLGIPIVEASKDLFFPLSILGVLLNIPLGLVAVMAIYGGSFCTKIVYSNLRFLKCRIPWWKLMSIQVSLLPRNLDLLFP